MPCRALIPLLLAAALAGAEGYDPAAHPARVLRRLAGWTQPVRSLDLAAEVAGRVAAVALEAGQRVPAGEAPVLRLDPELAALAVRQAEAAQAQAQAAAEAAAVAVHAAAAQQEAAQAEARRAGAEAAHAGRERARVARLHAGGQAGDQERDAALLAEAQTAQGLEAAQARVRQAEAAAEQSRTALSAAQAQAQAQAAALAAARAHLARHELRAPAGWMVRERLCEPGAHAAPGQPLLRLADTSGLVVALRVDEAELADLRRQDADGSLRARFAAAGREAAARLRRVDVAFDPVSRKRLAELLVAGADAPEASGGLAVEIAVAVPDPAGGLLVPAALAAWRLEQPWLRLADGREAAALVLRREGDALVVAPGGLPPDARLVPFPAATSAAAR